ncbi:acyltransferase family protein [Alkalicoccobacillus murimartini]|uniref:Peptidoglycan/LPS O-acetylase OafA/YrhL n=1 Tax=Alkalicoccobacillus murimartini TaxID=171685 RepID=A0ABT9YM88_9BACI|nr:acyltransferase family protein [Alkalicoccobacillus murimartini]MDQ0208856.1 peptidoglycan/LPS O-acetylase OafA/YrhL [Alkalicoccobacillus murimartini]
MNQTKTYYHSIDVFRLICAVAVVVVHITSQIPSNGIATWSNYYSYRYVLDIGSPFFFMAAGFILYRKSKEIGPGYLLTYAKKIFSYYLIFSIFYMITRVILEAISASLLNESVRVAIETQLNQWRTLNLLNGSIGSFQLYFLVILIYSALFLYILLRYKANTLALVTIAVALYAAENAGLLSNLNIFEYKSFAFGLLFVTLGFALSHSKEFITYKTPWLYTILFGAAYVCNYYYQVGLGWILLPLFTFSLGAFCVQYHTLGKSSLLTKLSTYSLAIYTLHIFVELLILKTVEVLGWSDYYANPLYYVGTIVACIVIPILIFHPIYNGAIWIKETFIFSQKKPSGKSELRKQNYG